MRLGAQMSAAGGLENAFARGAEVGCETIMLFTKSNRRWKAKPLTNTEIKAFHEADQAHAGIHPVAAHASYLINIASVKPALWQKSRQALETELRRADELGIAYLTFHPGAYVDADEQTGLDNIVRALEQIVEATAGTETILCLETMAGTGTTLGHRFEQLAYVLNALGEAGRQRLGVCFDTCHVFSAGYDIRTPAAYEATLAEFDAVVGLEWIKCFHFNDSKHPLGARKDRHDHIGAGHIGLSGFANFVNDPRWADYPAHLETPKEEEDDDGNEIEMDPINLTAVRDLID
ncbi:MAG: deoxyribonuclease IV [Candidatus Promineifilaceae bacterium]|nr:deoxyribonuclease IV [Candidatus Promineifilaceae bacterium]